MKILLLCLLVAGVIAAPSRKPTFRRRLNRIVGGQDAEHGEIEYILSLQDTSYEEPWHFCAATLYYDRWAITAALCVQDYAADPGIVQAVGGEYTLGVDDKSEQAETLDKIIVHPDYDPYTLENDIALIHFYGDMVSNEYVNPIGPQEEKEIIVEDCVVTGWGNTEEGGEYANVLQKVTVPTISDTQCKNYYEGYTFASTMICAGYEEGGKDACSGDSGGPMVCLRLLTGIVSWGNGCARPHYPGVYTEVAYYVDWIMDTIFNKTP